jgi:tol-pal system protein YbgF
MLVILALTSVPVMRCAGSGQAVSTAEPAVAAVTTGGEAAQAPLARVETLETEAVRRERRIRELESRLAMADAQVQELRDEAVAREEEAARPVVRIGDARAGTRSEREREPVVIEAPEEEAEDTGPRPVLRLYGPPEMPASAYAPMMPAGAVPMQPMQPMPQAMPAAMPQYLPAPPMVGGLGPLPVVAPPGMRSMVPPIPDRPLAVLPAPPMATLGAAPATVAPRTTDDPAVREYQAALNHVAARRFDEALAGLGTFLRVHPSHPYADNAMFWRGEVLYMRRDYAAAERELAEMVRRFPRGNKVPDALLRLGFCRQRQGDLEGARTYFRRVRAEHPGTVAARLASREDT